MKKIKEIAESIKRSVRPIEVIDTDDLIRKVNKQFSSGYAGVAANGAVNVVSSTSSNATKPGSSKPWTGDFDTFMQDKNNRLVFK